MNRPAAQGAVAGELSFVASEGYWAVRPAWEFRAADPRRYDALMVATPAQLGWTYVAYPKCVMVLDQAGVLSLGWAGRTRRRELGRAGVNLAYASAARAEGKGFATLAAALALLELERSSDVGSEALVHAQFSCANPRSGSVAARLGLVPDDALKVHVPMAGEGRRRAYNEGFLGMSAPWPQALERARQVAGGAEVVAWEDYAGAGEEGRQWPRSRMT